MSLLSCHGFHFQTGNDTQDTLCDNSSLQILTILHHRIVLSRIYCVFANSSFLYIRICKKFDRKAVMMARTFKSLE